MEPMWWSWRRTRVAISATRCRLRRWRVAVGKDKEVVVTIESI
jgi:hypothetical protein